jgi:hypothetical protein
MNNIWQQARFELQLYEASFVFLPKKTENLSFYRILKIQQHFQPVNISKMLQNIHYLVKNKLTFIVQQSQHSLA